ncbi:PucR family transcriptional regulator [Helicovermis profundi]|uniref:PucR family transcriptional regulator n=1 Tax=Helicovermis profundi TaxID=3065157 RepID=A0AAU9E1Y5_9FIRM|nr:PucR family transcriptional regulator [Clostridia bacterium S502]
MYIELIEKLNTLFNTEVILKTNANTYIPNNLIKETFKDYIPVGINKGVYIKDKILEKREKALLKYLLEEFLETNNTFIDILNNKNSYKNMSLDITYPFYIWEIASSGNSKDIMKIIKSIYPKDIVFEKNENSIIVFKQIPIEEENSIEDVYCDLESEILSDISLYVSYEVTCGKDIYDAHLNLDTLKEFSKIVRSKNNVYEFNKLLLPNIFLNIKNEDNLNYLKDIFQKNNRYTLDEELLNSALIFFESNLNITEAANKLYIHRNTLVYRLKKILIITGYDIRKFHEAINFYLNYLYDNLIEK